METIVHIVIFLSSAAIVWFFAGVLIEAVNRIARRFNKTGFLVAFFILGALTSIGELSVAANSLIGRVPEVAVGNLIGATFVVLLFIVPFLAAAGRGIVLSCSLSKRMLFFILAMVALPALLVIDGDVTRMEGLLAVLSYGTIAYVLYKTRTFLPAVSDLPAETLSKLHATLIDIGRILIGGVAIFLAAHFLVEQAVFFAEALSVPASLVGLILLSIGTNIPEIVIAIRAVLRRQTDVAFGDYLGSTSMNTLIFGVLALLSGTFFLEASEFIVTTALLIAGLVTLYVFAGSNYTLSRREGALLILFYVAFLAFQFYNVVRFATDNLPA